MTAMTFDTLEASKRLRDAGLDERAAEAIVELVQQSTDWPDISHLATKADIRDVLVKADLANLATKADIRDMVMKTDIRDMVVKADLANLATKADMRDMVVKADIQDMLVKADIRDMATTGEIALLRVEAKRDIAELEIRLGDKIRQQTWAVLGGVATIVMLATTIIKLVP
ncbi:MAG: hypothetical protein JWP92_3122 [Caulobacter sp.]|nr:hypothetical protein [Caulobacter sp.]